MEENSDKKQALLIAAINSAIMEICTPMNIIRDTHSIRLKNSQGARHSTFINSLLKHRGEFKPYEVASPTELGDHAYRQYVPFNHRCVSAYSTSYAQLTHAVKKAYSRTQGVTFHDLRTLAHETNALSEHMPEMTFVASLLLMSIVGAEVNKNRDSLPKIGYTYYDDLPDYSDSDISDMAVKLFQSGTKLDAFPMSAIDFHVAENFHKGTNKTILRKIVLPEFSRACSRLGLGHEDIIEEFKQRTDLSRFINSLFNYVAAFIAVSVLYTDDRFLTGFGNVRPPHSGFALNFTYQSAKSMEAVVLHTARNPYPSDAASLKVKVLCETHGEYIGRIAKGIEYFAKCGANAHLRGKEGVLPNGLKPMYLSHVFANHVGSDDPNPDGIVGKDIDKNELINGGRICNVVTWMVGGMYIMPSTPMTYATGLFKSKYNGDDTKLVKKVPVSSSVSCFLTSVADASEGIGGMMGSSCVYSSGGGGMSHYMGGIRAGGSPISKGGFSPSVIDYANPLHAVGPFVNQGSRRATSILISLPIHHLDVRQLMDIHKPRAAKTILFSIYSSIVISDGFMRSAAQGGKWLLLSPSFYDRERTYEFRKQTEEETAHINEVLRHMHNKHGFDLHKYVKTANLFTPEIYDPNHNEKYFALIELAVKYEDVFLAITGAHGNFAIVDSMELLQNIAASMMQFSKPWLVFYDNFNKSYPLIFNVPSSNLCTEIKTGFFSAENKFSGLEGKQLDATCVLSNINMEGMADVVDGVEYMHLDLLSYASMVCTDMLNAVTFGNKYPDQGNLITAFGLRPIGIGTFGMQEVLWKLGLGYSDIKSLAQKLLFRHVINVSAVSRSLALQPEAERQGIPNFEDVFNFDEDTSMRVTTAFKRSSYTPLAQHSGSTMVHEIDKALVGTGAEITLEECRRFMKRWVNGVVGRSLNSVLTSCQPTASSSKVAGVTADMPVKFYFPAVDTVTSRAGARVEFYIVEALRAAGCSATDIKKIVQYIKNSGGTLAGVSAAFSVEDDTTGFNDALMRIEKRFKTGFELDQEVVIANTVAAQHCVSQTISHDSYLPKGATGDDVLTLIMRCHEEGVNTMYYVYTQGAGDLHESVRDMVTIHDSVDGGEEVVKQCLIDNPDCEACQ